MFVVTVTFVAVLALAALVAFATVEPTPAFLFDVNALEYVIVAVTFPFVHAVGLGVIVIEEVTTLNADDTFMLDALFPALSVTFVHR